MQVGASPARLAIDARHLKTGIGNYTRNLIAGLNRLRYGPLHILTRSEHRNDLFPYCSELSIANADIYSVQEQFTLPFAARRNPLLHVPHYNAPLLYSGNLLLTIHDLTHLLYAGYRENWKTKMYASPLLHLAAVRAAHIFTVSEYSKTKLVEVLRVDPARITVVYNGVASGCGPGNKEEARDEVARQFGVGRPYILYVGSLKPHKNLETLVDAYGLLCGGTTTPEFQLVLAGAGRQGQERLMRRAVDLGLRPLFIGDADDVELVDLYRAAEVVVLPSLEEGFGLPIVEAMACGTPVICAHAASMPEIAGDAALFFDPLDANDLCRVLRQVLSSKDLSDSLSARGLLRAQQFSWDRTAARHIPVYDRYLM